MDAPMELQSAAGEEVKTDVHVPASPLGRDASNADAPSVNGADQPGAGDQAEIGPVHGQEAAGQASSSQVHMAIDPPSPSAPLPSADPPTAPFSDAQPTSSDTHFDPISTSASASTPNIPNPGLPASSSAQTLVGDGDDLMSSSLSTGSIATLKRGSPDHPGAEDDLRFAKRPREGEQEEQKIHEGGGEDVDMADAGESQQGTPAQANGLAVNGAANGPTSNAPSPSPPVTAPAVPAAGLAPPTEPAYIVGSYQPPIKPRLGPTSPLTAIQHRSLLSYIKAMKKQKEAGSFLQPVDFVAFNIPHYPKYIPKPTDIGTVEAKLLASDPDPKKRSRVSQADAAKGTFGSVAEVVDEVRQIFINTRIFNGPAHWVTQLADKLEEGFDKYLEKAPLQEVAPFRAPTPPTPKAASPPTPLEHRPRRPSVSIPTIRRNSDDAPEGSGSRPKREIHPPAPKDQAYELEVSGRKAAGSPEAQLEWTRKTVEDMKRLPDAFDFLVPVDYVKYNIPDYPLIIKHMMDLSTITKKLSKHSYADASGVDADVRLMCKNAVTYNAPGAVVHEKALVLERFWQGRWSNRPWTKGVSADDAELQEIDRQIAELQSRREEVVRRGNAARDNKERTKMHAGTNGQSGSKLGKHSSGVQKPGRPAGSGKPKHPSTSSGKPRKSSVAVGASGMNGRSSTHHNGGGGSGRKSNHYDDMDGSGEDKPAPTTLSQQQKQDLADKIGNAAPDVLQQAIVIIQEQTKVGDNGEEIELDIDALPPDTVVRLYNLVVLGLAGGKAKTKRRSKPKQQGGPGGAVNGGGQGKKKGTEMERIQKMEQQLAVPDGEDADGDSDASSVAYSEEEYSAEEA